MTPPLFLVDSLPGDDLVVLDGDEGRHAARVKRLGLGEHVLVSDGRGAVAECVVAAVDGDRLQLTVTSRRADPEPDPRLVVIQALPKGDRGELTVEVLTELGADEIVPWAASRSIAQWRDTRGDKALAKWRRTAREASKQSRRTRVPLVSPLATTADVAARLAASAAALVLHEAADEPLAGVPLPSTGEIALVVGPEGGITDGELALFAAAIPVRLGSPVLRTSTAGAAGLAAVSLRAGRWS
jgi:16S rRNA (uracil1498-N3)-methyltransferase